MRRAPRNRPGGRRGRARTLVVLVAALLVAGSTTACSVWEREVPGQAAPVDPLKGISATTGNNGGSRAGTELNDNLRGGSGSDKITGLGGDDVLWGDQNHDALAGAKQASDVLDGGAGNDTIYGGRGTNTIFGSDGDDFLQGGGLRSIIDGGTGNDKIKVTSGAKTTVDGGDGDDTITAIIARGRATIKCGPGYDTVIESEWPGNRKLVKISGDCEKRTRHKTSK